MEKYCCEIKQYCHYDPSKCPIAKRNKEIVEFEKAKEVFMNEIKKPFIKFLDWLDWLIKKMRK